MVLIVVVLGVFALSTDRLALGGLLAFLALLMQSFGPVRTLADLIPSLYSTSAGVERVVELLDEPAGGDRPGATPLPSGRGALSARGVSLTYPAALTSARGERRRRAAPVAPMSRPLRRPARGGRR